MISNHYPMTYGYQHAWLVLIAIMLLAAYVRHFFNLRHKGRTVWAIPVTAAARHAGAGDRDRAREAAGRAPTRSPTCRRSSPQRCATCHAAKPTQEGFSDGAQGRDAATRPQLIVANAQKINEQAVVTKVMPIGNLTGMTDAERATLARVDRGRGARGSKVRAGFGTTEYLWGGLTLARGVPAKAGTQRPSTDDAGARAPSRE